MTVRKTVNNKNGRLKPGMFVRAKVQVKVGQSGQMIDNSLAGKWVSPMHPEIISDKPGPCTVCGMDLVPAEELGFTKKSINQTPLVVPASAVMITGKRAIVYIKSSKPGLYEGRVITLGSRAGNDYIVKAGLKEGELVVVNGSFKIDSSLQILAKPSMMSETPKKEIEVFDTPKAFRESLEPVLDSYFSIAKDLSLDQYDNLRSHRQSLEKAFAEVEVKGLKAPAQEQWAKKSRQIILKGKWLSNSKSLDQARQRFQVLSQLMQDLVQHFEPIRKIHLAYCPMAFENRGAYWLQSSDKIENPYFGSMMYRCGSIKESFDGAK